VALIAIQVSMAVFQREKVMVEIRPGPGKSGYQMAFGTIGGISGQEMVWLGSCFKIGLVAIVAFNAKRIKTEVRG
jgi:hypothetical protein